MTLWRHDCSSECRRAAATCRRGKQMFPRDARGRSRWCRWSFSARLLSEDCSSGPCRRAISPLTAAQRRGRSQLASAQRRGGRSATQRPQRETSETKRLSVGSEPPPTPSRAAQVYVCVCFLGKWTQHWGGRQKSQTFCRAHERSLENPHWNLPKPPDLMQISSYFICLF